MKNIDPKELTMPCLQIPLYEQAGNKRRRASGDGKRAEPAEGEAQDFDGCRWNNRRHDGSRSTGNGKGM